MSSRYRPYQSQLVEDINAAWQRVLNVIAVCSTGSGKTVMAAGILSAEQRPSVFIAHRTELVSQASLALAREGVRHNIVGPVSLRRSCSQIHIDELGVSYVEPRALRTVAGVDTLVRMSATDSWFTQVRLWICDEAAHLLSDNKWGRAVAMFPNARGLGFTATPTRSDGRGLGRHADGVFDEMVQGPSMRWLIDNGYLTPYRLFCPPNDIDLSTVPVSNSGDFSPEKLRSAVHKSHVVGDIVTHYQRLAAGKLGMTFCVDVDAAEEVAAAFRAAGVSAEVITGKTPDLLRARLMRQFRAREILQLVSVDIMGEGVDVPAVEVVQLARPTQSVGLHMQQVGRGLRLMTGKSHALILDHAGNSMRHGLVDAHREWSLDRRERRNRAAPTDVIPVRACLKCTGVYERVLKVCPYCGHAVVPAGRSAPEQVDGDLTELDPAVLAKMRGEIDRVNETPSIGQWMTPEIAGRHKRLHWERQQAQSELGIAMDAWGGWQKHLGREPAEAMSRFYFRFGIDSMTARTLGAAEAKSLAARVAADLDKHNVRCE